MYIPTLWVSIQKHLQASRLMSPKKKDFFSRHGLGPTKCASQIKAGRYRGPPYPEPALPQKFPSTALSQALCNKARQAWAHKTFEEAQDIYEQATADSPQNPDFLFEKSQLLWSQSRRPEAIATLHRALAIQPNQARAFVSLTILTRVTCDLNLTYHFWEKAKSCQPPPLARTVEIVVDDIR
jgi:tetratricopeptide (TPR) repeat protein